MSRKITICAEYIWLGGNYEFRSKTKCIYPNITNESITDIVYNINNYPVWNYDGSSTDQATGSDSEILIRPVRIWRSPFKYDSALYSMLVLCETIYPDGSYPITSTRHTAKELFDQNLAAKPWFGIEQEFYLFTKHKISKSNDSHKSLGQYDGIAEPQGRYYCSVGGTNAFGRELVSNAFNKCIEININVSGMNAEVGPGQWEIQVGPCEGINAGDELLMLRYILERVSEDYNMEVVFTPKPLIGDWNGSGCHTNYSTYEMRNGRTITPDQEAVALQKGIVKKSATGYECILEAIEKLKENHEEHMIIYGKDNELRMTGLHETAGYNTFTHGVADRSASIRIPRSTEKDQKGYLEDRRPGSNMDPYIVTSKIFETTVL